MKFKVFLGIIIIAFTLGAWEKDGVPVCQTSGDQWDPKVVALESGMTAICWQDGRMDTVKLYFQVLDSLGNPLFSKDGARVSNTKGTQIYQSMVSNGEDIFVVWEDASGITRENTDIFATKINGLTGMNEWGTVEVCTALGSQYTPQLCLAGSDDGCYITWTDYRSGSGDIYATRITKEGQVVWEAQIDSLSGPRTNISTVVPSGDGALIFWREKRGDTVGLYGNRILGDSLQWGPYGKLIILNPYPYDFSLVLQGEYSPFFAHPDQNDGAFVFFFDRVQKVDSSGNVLFNPPVEVSSPYKSAPTEDRGVVGCYFLSGGPPDYCQSVKGVKVDNSGKLPWDNPMVIWKSPILDTTYYHTPYSSVIGDYHGGCITAIGGWHLRKEMDIITVLVDSSGSVGEPSIICSANADQQNPVIVQESSTKGYIVVWEDGRNGNIDLYVQYIDSAGQVGIGEEPERNSTPNKALLSVEPNPFSKTTKISSENRVTSSEGIKLNIYDVAGKLVKSFFLAPQSSLLATTMTWDGSSDSGQLVSPGVYFCQLETKDYQVTQKMVRVR